MNRSMRVAATLLVTGLAAAYVIYKVDLGKTLDIIRSASPWWLALSALLTIATMPPMAWRWQRLLDVRGIHENFWWLLRAYFVSTAVGQILPTSVGGDASRIFETSRRHPGQITPITGSVLLERAIGGAVTVLLAGVGLLLALGRYDIGAYVWIEVVLVAATILAGVTFFSRTVRARLRFGLPYARRLRLETPARAVYDGIHGYRDHVPTLIAVAVVTIVMQVSRIVAIYASGRAVGINLPLLPYFVLGPLLFLVLLVPFTINGLGVREAFFVSFLGKLGVDADAAFACGFIFFVMTILLALPGLVIILWEGVRRRPTVMNEPA
jgi:uncharacterized protein (TIRG00374 family)